MSNYFDQTQAPPDESEGSRYLGIPEGYMGPRAMRHDPTYRSPDAETARFGRKPVKVQEPYARGDELSIVKWDSKRIANWQNWARSVGLIGANSRLIRGVADAPTVSAFKKLLTFSNQQGLSWMESMEVFSSAGQEEAKPSRPFVAPTRRPLDDKVVELGVKDAFQDVLGRDPTADEFSRFVNAFRARENQYFAEQEGAARQKHDLLQREGIDPLAAGVGGGELDSGATVGRIPTPGQMSEADLIDTDDAKSFHAARLGLGVLQKLQSGRL